MRINVSFSGGRTSAYMAWWLNQNHDCNFIFMNTGCEHEATLDFVNECSNRWGLNVVWLECVVYHGERKGTGFKVTNYTDAARDSEPMEEVIKKYGLPNADYIHCTRETKLAPFKTYTKARGIDKNPTAIGIRSDEVDRVNPNHKAENFIYPLITMNPTKESDIMWWWQQQDFDLGIHQYEGNCRWCYKKTLRKLVSIKNDDVTAFDFPKRMEAEYSDAMPGDTRKIFRGYRTTEDILNLDIEPFRPESTTQKDMLWDAAGGCG
jgi:hypothetical protein